MLHLPSFAIFEPEDRSYLLTLHVEPYTFKLFHHLHILPLGAMVFHQMHSSTLYDLNCGLGLTFARSVSIFAARNDW